MKVQAAFLLILVTVFACSQGTKVTVRPQAVLGVKLGGSVQELKAVYEENRLSLQEAAEDRYESVDTARPVTNLSVVDVSYRISSGVVQVMEVSFRGGVSDELQALIDEEHPTDPDLRQQLEQKQRF